jgi:hypothetical protein
MSGGPTVPRARFTRWVVALTGRSGGKTPHRDGFDNRSLFIGRTKFGLLDESGALVLQLPPPRVQELIRDGLGVPWHPDTGKPLKGYVAAGSRHHSKWLGLAKEARASLASKG